MFGLGIGSMGNLKGGNSLSSKIKKLFTTGQAGAWYDFSQLSQEFQDSAGTTAVTAVEQPLGKVNDISGRTNHLTQATAGARPVVSARVNLLTKTEDFASAGSWILNNGLTAVAQQLTFVNTNSFLQAVLAYSGLAPSNYTAQARLSCAVSTTLTFAVADSMDGDPLFSSNINVTPTPTTFTVSGNFAVNFNGNITMQLLGNGVVIAGSVVTVHEIQLEQSAIATRYQRVNTATDYDTSGFPTYAKFDGADDSMTSTTGGGSTTGFFFCGAVKLLGVNASEQHIFSDQVGNNGYIIFLPSSSGVPYLAVGNGTGLTFIPSATSLSIGETALITAWDDGVNLNIQVNNASVATVARPVVTAGSTSISVGKSNVSASSYFNGNIYPEIYRTGTPLTAVERAAAQAWCKSKAGL